MNKLEAVTEAKELFESTEKKNKNIFCLDDDQISHGSTVKPKMDIMNLGRKKKKRKLILS